MSNFKERLLAEQSELNDKVEKLSAFIVAENFDKIDQSQQNLLNEQLPAMRLYNCILKKRIELLD